MDWNKGFSATFYGCIVDRNTWRDIERFDIMNGQISRSETSLIEAADFDTDHEIHAEQWIRIYMDTRQDGATDHVALFTGLASAPTKSIIWSRADYSLECYSVLKPAEDVLLPRGYFAPEGVDGGTLIRNLLEVTPAPVELDGEMPRLQEVIVAEQGENSLSMVWKILNAINRRIRIESDGTIRITAKASMPVATFDALINDVVEPTLSMTNDWFSCPNVFRAVSGDAVAVARDEDPDSELSIIARGREIWMEEDASALNDGEGIAAYAQRRLKEEQARGYEIDYTRRYDPAITVSDIVSLHYPGQGLNGDYRVITQQISLNDNCRTEEQVEYS